MVIQNIVADSRLALKQTTLQEKSRNANLFESVHSNSSGTVNQRMQQHHLQQEAKSIKLQHFYQSDIQYDNNEEVSKSKNRKMEGEMNSFNLNGDFSGTHYAPLDFSNADLSSQQIVHDQSINIPVNADRSILMPVRLNDSAQIPNTFSQDFSA